MGMFSILPLPYKILGGLVIMTVLIGGAGLWGYNKAENKYIAKIAKLEADTLILQIKLNNSIGEIKLEVLTKYVDRVKVIKEKEYVYINQAINDVPAQCELSSGWVYLHDAAARGADADPTRSSDGTPSGVKDNQALAVVAENYAISAANIEKIKSLQEFIVRAEEEVRKQNEAAKKAAKKRK